VVCQGVLAVVVAADRGADPAEGRGPDVGGDPQQRCRAVRGGAELPRQHIIARELHRGAVDGGDLQLLPQQADAQVRVGDGRVQLEQPFHDLLAEQLPGLRERRPGRDARARLEIQPGQAERRREDAVVAGAGEQARDQHAHHGHLRGQRPVVPVPCGRFGQRAGDHAAGQQFLQQPLPVQLREPVRPAPQRMHQVRLEGVVLQQLGQPAPAERGLECHRRSRGQIADQPQERLGAVHHVLVQLHLAVLGDHRHLGSLAMHIDADVNRHCRVSSPELVLSPGASCYRAELGRGPALIGSCERGRGAGPRRVRVPRSQSARAAPALFLSQLRRTGLPSAEAMRSTLMGSVTTRATWRSDRRLDDRTSLACSRAHRPRPDLRHRRRATP
jgi:hypothetical protein